MSSTERVEIIIPLERWQANIQKAGKHADRERMVRVYTEQHGECIAVQVRAPMRLAHGEEGKDFVIAHATMNLTQLRKLRDDLDKVIAENEEP